MNAADFTNYKQIKEFHIFDGDFPAINYEYKDGKLYTYTESMGVEMEECGSRTVFLIQLKCR